MVEFQRYTTNPSTDATPTVRFSFDESLIADDWAEVQHYVDFLSAMGGNTAVVAALQAVIDTNYTP